MCFGYLGPKFGLFVTMPDNNSNFYLRAPKWWMIIITGGIGVSRDRSSKLSSSSRGVGVSCDCSSQWSSSRGDRCKSLQPFVSPPVMTVLLKGLAEPTTHPQDWQSSSSLVKMLKIVMKMPATCALKGYHSWGLYEWDFLSQKVS